MQSMNKTAAGLGQLSFVVSIALAMIFPEKVFGNIYILMGYLVIALVMIYLVFLAKPGKQT